MQYKIVTDPKRMIGKRPNLADEKSVTDDIVSAFSVPPEDMPLPPLSPLPQHTPASATAPAAPRKKHPKVLSIIGTVLVYLPLLYAAAATDRSDAVTFPVEGVDGGSVSMLSIKWG